MKDDELIFPVLLLYPESSQSDYVREMGELDTFTDVFNVDVSACCNVDAVSKSPQSRDTSRMGRGKTVHGGIGGVVVGGMDGVADLGQVWRRRCAASTLPRASENKERR